MLSARVTLGARPVAARAAAPRPAARAAVVVARARGAAWSPGDTAPEHLDGSLPGDFGFDPLYLGTDKAQLAWYAQAELQHARWAMLGVAGVLVPDVLAHIGVSLPPTSASTFSWLEVAEAKTAFPLADASTLALTIAFFFSWAEHKRLYEYKTPGSQGADGTIFKKSFAACNSADQGYPGGPFNPLNYPAGPEQKLKEIKNGRLAMVAFAGFLGQALSTGVASPIDNLAFHLADPWHNNIAANSVALPHLF